MSAVYATFRSASNSTYKSKKRAAPFCLRFTEEERAYLEQLAGNKPLGT